MAEKRTGLTVPSGILQPTMPPDDPTGDEGQGSGPAKDEGQEVKATRSRKNQVTTKASSSKVEGRKLYLPEEIHFRLRMLAYQRGQKLSECAAEVLDKALPRWDVSRMG